MRLSLRALVVVASLTASLSIAPRAEAQLAPDDAHLGVVRPDVMQRVTRALFLVEDQAPPSFYAALGREGRDALLTILRDETRPVGLRRRAVLALGHYAEPMVRAELESRSVSAAEDAIVSRYALRTLAAAFGPPTFDFVAGRLSDARAFVREGAAIALTALDAARARPILRARLSTEDELFVRETIAALVAR